MLKEFDLDMPLADPVYRREFRNQSRSVTALFEKFYKPTTESREYWKILVEVSKNPQPKIKNLLGVIAVQVSENREDFLHLDPVTKQKEFLNYLMAGINKVTKELQWPNDSFELAREAVLDSKFVNERVWGKPIRNPSKNLAAEIFIQHELTKAIISIRIRDAKKNIIKIKHILESEPNEFAFVRYLGKLNWIDDRNLELINAYGTDKIAIKV
jgi:hypothetical protein